MRFRERPEEPWDGFLKALDATVTGMVRLDCIGGFVMTQLYGMQRPTLDVDVIELAPQEIGAALLQIAARGGSLAKQHSIYIDRVAVASIPEDYESRLVEMFPRAYVNLRLMAVDPYDLALSKLERNHRKDREDVAFLARHVPLDLQILQDRYRTEMRWQLGLPAREDLTMRLWIEMIEEERTAP